MFTWILACVFALALHEAGHATVNALLGLESELVVRWYGIGLAIEDPMSDRQRFLSLAGGPAASLLGALVLPEPLALANLVFFVTVLIPLGPSDGRQLLHLLRHR
jgi:Zn-dependent protease